MTYYIILSLFCLLLRKKKAQNEILLMQNLQSDPTKIPQQTPFKFLKWMRILASCPVKQENRRKTISDCSKKAIKKTDNNSTRKVGRTSSESSEACTEQDHGA